MEDYGEKWMETETGHRWYRLFFFIPVRMVLGMGSIYYINRLLADWQIDVYVGCNVVSLLTTASLGFSGVALLYAVCACKFL